MGSMNFLTLFIIGVITIAVAYLTACIFSPKNVATYKSMVIRQPVEVVFKEVVDLNRWNTWHPLFSQLGSEYFQIKTKVGYTGSEISWSADGNRGGRIIIKDLVENERITTNIRYESEDYKKVNEAEFLFEANPSGTKITWVVIGTEYPFLKRPITLMLKEVFSKNIEKGLLTLKRNCENSASTPQ